jgi:hypothetical protein
MRDAQDGPMLERRGENVKQGTIEVRRQYAGAGIAGVVSIRYLKGTKYPVWWAVDDAMVWCR